MRRKFLSRRVQWYENINIDILDIFSACNQPGPFSILPVLTVRSTKAVSGHDTGVVPALLLMARNSSFTGVYPLGYY